MATTQLRYAIELAEDNRVVFVTYESYATKKMQIVDVIPEGDITEYRYENGEFIHDPLPQEETEEEEPTVEDDILEMMVDHETRILELELGVE